MYITNGRFLTCVEVFRDTSTLTPKFTTPTDGQGLGESEFIDFLFYVWIHTEIMLYYFG